MTSKAQRKARRKREKAAMEARKWEPQDQKDRPTPERLAKSGMRFEKGKMTSLGAWVLGETDRAGVSVAIDRSAHPIDDLERRGVLSNEQASAGRSFEELSRAATEVPGVRDSCTLWEPKGFESDDGNIDAVRAHRDLTRRLGMIRDQLLRRVCVYHEEPKPTEIGLLREALNEAGRFFR